MAINYTLLFDRIREMADLVVAVKTWQGTTLSAALDAVLAEYSTALVDSDSYDYVRTLVTSCQSQQNSTSIMAAVKTLMQAEVIRQVQADVATMTSATITTAIDELVRQMDADSQSVAKNTCTVTVSSPTTKAQLIVSAKHPGGLTTELAFAETFSVKWTGSALQILGERKYGQTSYLWPDGSGVAQTISPVAAGGLIANGVFDEEDSIATGLPGSWSVITGNVGTSIKMTEYESQTLTTSGTPTSGWYNVTVTDPDGNIQTTAPLSFDASGSDLQTAIRELTGFGSVEVETTGTSPNYAHTVTFTGVAGNVPDMTVHVEFDTGTVTQGAGTAVDTSGLKQRTMVWVGDGSELTKIEQVISPSALTQYGFHVRMKRQDTSTTGVIVFRLVDGAGTVINDDEGAANTYSVNMTAVSNSAWTAATTFFRLPSVLPTIVKFQMLLSTALANTKKLYIDELTLTPVTQLGKTGLYAAAFAGHAASAITDSYSLSSTNDYGGKLQSLFMRNFDRQLPSSASPTISDT